MALKGMGFTQLCLPIAVLLHWYDNWELYYPEYQRGDVWGLRRRRYLIRSLLVGIPVGTLIVNRREWKSDRPGDWQDLAATDTRLAVIDGRQRLETLWMFYQGELTVPGSWWDREQEQIRFSDLTVPEQRKFQNKAIDVLEGSLECLEDEELCFDMVNYGGVPQGEVDDDLA